MAAVLGDLGDGSASASAWRAAKLSGMDAVRFGRALGVGARQAAKTLVTAVDAATAENPSKTSTGAAAGAGDPVTPVRPVAQTAVPVAQAAVRTAAEMAAQARMTRQALDRGRKRFGQAAWEPVTRLSSVLWLEVSGVFFGIFALAAMGAVWRYRAQWHGARPQQEQLLGAAAMALVFTYFCISNFVRARRREQER